MHTLDHAARTTVRLESPGAGVYSPSGGGALPLARASHSGRASAQAGGKLVLTGAAPSSAARGNRRPRAACAAPPKKAGTAWPSGTEARAPSLTVDLQAVVQVVLRVLDRPQDWSGAQRVVHADRQAGRPEFEDQPVQPVVGDEAALRRRADPLAFLDGAIACSGVEKSRRLVARYRFSLDQIGTAH